VENVPVDRPAASAITAIECGDAFESSAGAGLTVTGRFPASVRSTEEVVHGTVEVASEDDVRGVVAPAADVFLVRNGRIATLPLPQDLVGMPLKLVAGKVAELPAQAALSPCDPGGGVTDGTLRPGTYELYARVVLNNDDGSSLEAVGGPWPLEVL
jgi:hypothetical protein